MQGRHFSMCQSGAVLFPLHVPLVIPMGSSCRAVAVSALLTTLSISVSVFVLTCTFVNNAGCVLSLSKKNKTNKQRNQAARV